jgi:type II secretory pathway predicted ATPase ExeA
MHHWGDLPNARVIDTEALRTVGDAVAATIRGRGIGLIFGPPGVGKTAGTTHHLAASGRAVIGVVLEGHPSDRELVARIYATVTGERYEEVRGTRRDLQHRLPDVMPDACALHIDEAQYLRDTGFKALRSVYDQGERRGRPIPTILSGGPEFVLALHESDQNRMLASRVVAKAELRPLSPEDVLEAVPEYHPIYAGVDLALVLRINRVARGEFRRWAEFTRQAAELCEEEGKRQITAAIADRVLQTFPER